MRNRVFIYCYYYYYLFLGEAELCPGGGGGGGGLQEDGIADFPPSHLFIVHNQKLNGGGGAHGVNG